MFGKDARDLLIECCVEFITLISSEANDISEKESKKTIACDHITKALEQLGFGAYVQEIMEVANEHKEQLKVCRFLIFNLFQAVQLMILSAGSREESKQTRTERLIRRSTPRNAGRGVQRCCPETRLMLFYCFPEICAGIFMVFLGCMDGLVALGFCFCTGTVARCFMIEIDNQWQGIKFSAEASSSRSYRRPDSNFFCPPSLAGT